MKGLISLFPLAIFLACAMSGCGPSPSPTPLPTTPRDPWYKAPPSADPPYWSWPELDRTRIHEVIESKQPDAEQLLQDVSSVELTSQQAAEFIGEALPEVPGTKPYLTRGVYLSRGTGRFSAYILADQLVVHHGSLGSGNVPMKRQALVLQLEQSPVEVFVTCSMAK
jgi:hypothetical protein